MNTFEVGNATFFEFHCDEILVNKILEKVKSLDYSLSASKSSPDSNMVGVGYQYVGDDKFVSLYDQELYDWIHSCLDEVSAKYLHNFKLRICDLWSVEAKFGQKARKHSHGFSLMSGLLYLTTCKRSETVFTYPDHVMGHWGFLREEIKNQTKEFKVKPEKGKLIIWPSDIEHSVNPHTDKETRYTVAFNSFIEGQIKMTTARLSLKVNDPCTEKFTHTDKPY